MRDLRWESKMDKEFGGSKTYRELQEGPKTTVKPAPDPKKEEYFPFPTDFKPDPELPIEVRDPAPSPVVGPVEQWTGNRTIRGGPAAQELWAEQSQRVRDGLEPNRLDASEGSNYPYTDAEVENTKPKPVFNPPAQTQQVDVESKLIEETKSSGYRTRIMQEGRTYKGKVIFSDRSDNRDISLVSESLSHLRLSLITIGAQSVTSRDIGADSRLENEAPKV